MTALATKAGVGVETVRKLVYGHGGSSSATIAAVATALRKDVRTVAKWAAEQRSVAEPFEMPAEADLLTARERRAVVELVRAITADRKAGDHRGNTAAIGADFGEFRKQREDQRDEDELPPMTPDELTAWRQRHNLVTPSDSELLGVAHSPDQPVTGDQRRAAERIAERESSKERDGDGGQRDSADMAEPLEDPHPTT